MTSDTPPKQISTRKGVLLIAVVVAAITLVSLTRHWAQNEAEANLAPNPSDWTPQTVAIFTNDSCTYCEAAKQFLADKKVPYTEFNLDHSEKARQVFGMLNGRGVPLIIVGKQRLNGFDPGTLTRMLGDQGFLR